MSWRCVPSRNNISWRRSRRTNVARIGSVRMGAIILCLHTLGHGAVLY
jgi:hypothetical protein